MAAGCVAFRPRHEKTANLVPVVRGSQTLTSYEPVIILRLRGIGRNFIEDLVVTFQSSHRL